MNYLLLSGVLLLLLALMFLGVRVVEGIEAENRMMQEEAVSMRRLRESLDRRSQEVRRYRHDAESLLRAIEAGAGGPDAGSGHDAASGRPAPDAAVAGSEKADTAGPAVPGAASCFPLAGAAVDLHVRQCAEAGIPFDYGISRRFWERAGESGMDDANLCLVLQNLLDNAFEASLELREAGRDGAWMSLRMDVDDGGLLLEVANRTAADAMPDMRTRKPAPELHGVGLQVVRDLAASHGGFLASSFDPATHVLTMRVRLGA